MRPYRSLGLLAFVLASTVSLLLHARDEIDDPRLMRGNEAWEYLNEWIQTRGYVPDGEHGDEVEVFLASLLSPRNASSDMRVRARENLVTVRVQLLREKLSPETLALPLVQFILDPRAFLSSWILENQRWPDIKLSRHQRPGQTETPEYAIELQLDLWIDTRGGRVEVFVNHLTPEAQAVPGLDQNLQIVDLRRNSLGRARATRESRIAELRAYIEEFLEVPEESTHGIGFKLAQMGGARSLLAALPPDSLAAAVIDLAAYVHFRLESEPFIVVRPRRELQGAEAYLSYHFSHHHRKTALQQRIGDELFSRLITVRQLELIRRINQHVRDQVAEEQVPKYRSLSGARSFIERLGGFAHYAELFLDPDLLTTVWVRLRLDPLSVLIEYLRANSDTGFPSRSNRNRVAVYLRNWIETNFGGRPGVLELLPPDVLDLPGVIQQIPFLRQRLAIRNFILAHERWPSLEPPAHVDEDARNTEIRAAGSLQMAGGRELVWRRMLANDREIPRSTGQLLRMDFEPARVYRERVIDHGPQFGREDRSRLDIRLKSWIDGMGGQIVVFFFLEPEERSRVLSTGWRPLNGFDAESLEVQIGSYLVDRGPLPLLDRPPEAYRSLSREEAAEARRALRTGRQLTARVLWATEYEGYGLVDLGIEDPATAFQGPLAIPEVTNHCANL